MGKLFKFKGQYQKLTRYDHFDVIKTIGNYNKTRLVAEKLTTS